VYFEGDKTYSDAGMSKMIIENSSRTFWIDHVQTMFKDQIKRKVGDSEESVLSNITVIHAQI
jgi:hypothetical protein